MALPPDRPDPTPPTGRRGRRWLLPAALIAVELMVIAVILLGRGPGGVALLARATQAPTTPPESPLQTLEAQVPRRYLPDAISPGVYFLDGSAQVQGQARSYRSIVAFLDAPYCFLPGPFEAQCARIDDVTMGYGSSFLKVLGVMDSPIQVELNGRKAYLTKIGEDTAAGDLDQDVLGKWSCPILDDSEYTTKVFVLDIRADGEVWISNEAGEEELMGRLTGLEMAVEGWTEEPARLMPMGEYLFLASETEMGFGCVRLK